MALERLGDNANEAGVLHSPELDPYRIYLTRFHGRGREYFRIWIVNLLLSVLTLGIYSPWAKVRREKYFHRTTQLNGHSFEYHGQPLAILKGRLLVFAVLIVLALIKKFSVTAHTVISLCMLPAIPWLMVRALSFRAANTSYCGVRFAFHGSYRQAAKLFFGYGLLVLCTLGLALPLWRAKMRTFSLDQLSYGSSRFRCGIATWQIVRRTALPFLACLTTAVLIGFLVGVGLDLLAPLLAGVSKFKPSTISSLGYTLGGTLTVVLLWWLPSFVLMPRLTNLIWSHGSLADGHFVSEQTIKDYLVLIARNWLFSLLSLGLFIPFARIAQARFRAERLALIFPGPLDGFTADRKQQAAALGDEASDALGLDLAL